MELENITGNLKDGYAQIKPGTMRHVDQLTTERRTNHALRNYGFYTADGELFTDQKNEIVPRDAPTYGDVMQRAEDNRRLFSEHSWERFKTQLGELYTKNG